MNDFEDRLRTRLHGLRDSIDPPPGLWARVEQRAVRRPWIPVTMAAVAAAVLLFTLIAGIGGGGAKRHIVAAGPGATDSTTTTDSGAGVEAPPTSQAPDTTPTTSTTTTGGTHSTTTTGATVNTVPPATTTSTTAPQDVNCSSQDVSLTTSTDRASYTPGETVQIYITATNTGSRPCDIPPPCGITPWGVTVTDSNGRAVWASPRMGVMCPTPEPGPDVLQPGHSKQVGPFSWDQKDCTPSSCPSTQVPRGRYTAQGDWRLSDGTATAQPTSFTIS